MEKIVIKQMCPPVTSLFNPNDEFIGFIHNEYELNDVRLQIQKHKLDGYYVLFNDIKIWIDEDGGIDQWEDGFYDTTTKQLNELLGI